MLGHCCLSWPETYLSVLLTPAFEVTGLNDKRVAEMLKFIPRNRR